MIKIKQIINVLINFLSINKKIKLTKREYRQ